MRKIKLTMGKPVDRYNDNEEGEGQSSPVTVNAEAIRCFYPRKGGRPGTRITFTDGGGFVVLESYDVVDGLVTNRAGRRPGTVVGGPDSDAAADSEAPVQAL